MICIYKISAYITLKIQKKFELNNIRTFNVLNCIWGMLVIIVYGLLGRNPTWLIFFLMLGVLIRNLAKTKWDDDIDNKPETVKDNES
jgi:hypothetical protein